MAITMTIKTVVEGAYAKRRAEALARSLRAQEGCAWVQVEPWRHSKRFTVKAGGFPWPESVPVSAMPEGCTPVYA
jgi:hypothetical protein